MTTAERITAKTSETSKQPHGPEFEAHDPFMKLVIYSEATRLNDIVPTKINSFEAPGEFKPEDTKRRVTGSYYPQEEKVVIWKTLTDPEFFKNNPEGQVHAIRETLTHEYLGHANCPYMHPEKYGSKENAMRAQNHAAAIAKQSKDLGIHLNGYHRWLAEQYDQGEISQTIYELETHAIMTELLVNDPKRLKIIENSQQKAAERRVDYQREFVPIVNGIKETLATLHPDIRDIKEPEQRVEKIEQRIEAWREANQDFSLDNYKLSYNAIQRTHSSSSASSYLN